MSKKNAFDDFNNDAFSSNAFLEDTWGNRNKKYQNKQSSEVHQIESNVKRNIRNDNSNHRIRKPNMRVALIFVVFQVIVITIVSVLVIRNTSVTQKKNLHQVNKKTGKPAVNQKKTNSVEVSSIYNDKDPDIIKKRFVERVNELREERNYYIHKVVVDNSSIELRRELSQNQGDEPYLYYVKLNEIEWRIPVDAVKVNGKIDPGEVNIFENSYRYYVASRLNNVIYSFLKENYKEPIEKNSFICLTLAEEPSANYTILGSVKMNSDLDDKLVSELRRKLLTELNNREGYKYKSDVSFSSEWCFSLYNYDYDLINDLNEVEFAENYPNVVIKSIEWQDDASDDSKSVKQFRSLIEKKIELFRDEIGECVSDFPETDQSNLIEFTISESGGPIFMMVDNKNTTPFDWLLLNKCIHTGSLLRSLYNDVPMRVDHETQVNVEFVIAPVPKPNANEIKMDTPFSMSVVPWNEDNTNQSGGKDAKRDTSKKAELQKKQPGSNQSKRSKYFKLMPTNLSRLGISIKNKCHFDNTSRLISYDLVINPDGTLADFNIKRQANLTSEDVNCLLDVVSQTRFFMHTWKEVHVSSMFVY